MGATDLAISDALIEAQIDLLRLDAGTRAAVLKLLERLQAELVATLNRDDLTAFNKARTQALLKQASAVIDDYYLKAQGELDTTLRGAARLTATKTGDILSSVFQAQIGVGLPTETFLARLVTNALISGAASADWWSRQAMDTQFRFANAVRQGLAAGETNEQIVRRITGGRNGVGIMEISARNARGLVHSSIQAVANGARLETFRKNSDVIAAVVWLATLDGHTCALCGARDNKQYTLDDQQPIGHDLPWDGGPSAIHFACRCVVSTVTKTFEELGIDLPEPPVGTRASSGGPVPAGTTFEQWLSRRTPAQVEEQLGKGRADLYLAGKITLADLLNMQGNPLTLKQLAAKYA